MFFMGEIGDSRIYRIATSPDLEAAYYNKENEQGGGEDRGRGEG